MTRSYDNRRRARGAEQTRERILDVTEHLLRTGSIESLTLAAIADGAEVSVQTVLRHLGSREGCILAVAERVGHRIDAQRGHSAPGDVAAALDGLLEHYEAEGRLVLNLLSQEAGGNAFVAQAIASGRAYHRDWVERCFGPLLPPAPEREEVVDALVSATDLYVWRLLRLDLGRSAASTRSTVDRLVRSVLESSWPRS